MNQWIRKTLAVAVLIGTAGAVIGCEASAKVGDPDSSDTSYKKTTVVRPDGSQSVHETKRYEK